MISQSVVLKTVATIACDHLHEVEVACADLPGLGIDQDRRHTILVMSDTVVTYRTGDVAFRVRVMIHDDTRRRRHESVATDMALRTLRARHLVSVHRDFAYRIERKLEGIGYRGRKLGESLDFVKEEGHRICSGRHMTRDARDSAVRRVVVCRNGVILDFMTDLRAEPIRSRRADHYCHKEEEERQEGQEPDYRARPGNWVFERFDKTSHT